MDRAATRGQADAKAEIDAVGKLLEKQKTVEQQLRDIQRQRMKEVAEATQRAKDQIQTMHRAATVAFAGMTAGLVGFVRAGLQGTVQGERMGLAWKQMSQQIAAVFLPVVEQITAKVEGVTRWFKNLSREQQDSVMKWSLLAAGALGVAVMLPKVIAGATAATAAIKAMTAATLASNNAFMANASRAGMVAAAWIAIARGITSGSEKDEKTVRERLENAEEAEAGAKMGGIGGAGYKVAKVARDTMGWIMGVETNADKLREQLKTIQEMRSDRRDVSLSGGSYEDTMSAYKRLQSAALKADMSGEKKVIQLQEATVEQLRQIKEELKKADPDKKIWVVPEFMR